MTVRICKKCKEAKDLSDFGLYKSRSGTCGLRFSCRACNNAHQRDKYKSWKNAVPSSLIATDSTKLCSKCGVEKSTTAFAVRLDNPKRIAKPKNWCRDCANKVGAVRNKHWRNNNPEAVVVHRVKTRDYHLEYNKKWYQDNIENERKKRRDYQLSHPEVGKANTAKYRASKRQRCPSWLTKDQLNEIKQLYVTCPPGYHVDHIIPLRGETVSGLHVPWNLAHLPAVENISKSNKLLEV